MWELNGCLREVVDMKTSKINKDLEMYCALMCEVKNRTHAIIEMLKGHTTTLYPITNIEFMCLQIRKVLELISMGSLVVNQEEFDAIGAQYSKFWNARLILQDIERLNPKFYPVAVNEVPTDEEGVAKDIQEKASGFLTREEFVTVYEKCGKMMHAQNPFGAKYDYESFKAKVLEWLHKIYGLLGSHLIHLKGDDGFYLIHMEERNNKGVHGYFFKRDED